MAALITVGNVINRADAERLQTKKLAAELKALRINAGLNFEKTQCGGYDVWVEANEGLSDSDRANAVSAVYMQAKRLRVDIR